MAKERIRLDTGDTSPQCSWRTAIVNATNDGTVVVALGFRPSRVSCGFVRLVLGESTEGYDYDPGNVYPELYVGEITSTGFEMEFRNVPDGGLVLWYDAI